MKDTIKSNIIGTLVSLLVVSVVTFMIKIVKAIISRFVNWFKVRWLIFKFNRSIHKKTPVLG